MQGNLEDQPLSVFFKEAVLGLVGFFAICRPRYHSSILQTALVAAVALSGFWIMYG